MTTEAEEANAVVVVRAAVRIQVDSILSLLQDDPHQWSARPCATCRAISTIVARPFGCLKYASDRRSADATR